MISYRELVDLALASHDPTWRAHKVQYASLLLTHDDQQHAIAEQRAARFAASAGVARLATRIEPLNRFWPAEEYHQKYHLRNDRTLAAEFQAMFGGDERAFRESTAAARVNGYVAGDGTIAQLGREIDFLGLTTAGRKRLVDRVSTSRGGNSCSVG